VTRQGRNLIGKSIAEEKLYGNKKVEGERKGRIQGQYVPSSHTPNTQILTEMS
jgi:hypothetical protein